MACKTCTNEPRIFNVVNKDDNEYYIEAADRSAWSIISPLTSSAIVNAFTNPSFEFNANGWTGGARVTTEAFAGAASYQFTTFAQFNTPWGATNIERCVSAMVKGCCGNTLRIGIYDGARWKFYSDLELTGCWQEISVCQSTYTAGFLPDFLRFEIVDGTCTDANYVDLITVVESTTDAFTPFDGDSINGAWNGNSHASTSTMAAYSRTVGSKTPLNDLGFNVISCLGHGVPPISQVATPYARRNGSYAQRARANARILTLTGEICGDDFSDLENKREAIINAIGLNLSGFGDCSTNREIYLAYECVSECGVLSGRELRIRVNYTSGLEGSRTRPFCERMTLVFTANEDPMFDENRQYCKVLTPGVTVTVKNCGNAYAAVRLFGRNRATLNLQKIENLTTGKAVEFGTGAGYTASANSDVIFNCFPGNTSFVEKTGATSTNLSGQMQVSSTSKPSHLMLAPGTNQITLTGSVTGASQFVLCWRNKFLSSSAACGDCDCEQP